MADVPNPNSSTVDTRLLSTFGGMVETANTTRIRRGIVYDKWPFRLDISVEYQDWILIGMVFLIIGIWCIPCICGSLRSGFAKMTTRKLYTQLHNFYVFVGYLTLTIMMFVVGVLPDWTVNQFMLYCAYFVSWVLLHMQKVIESATIIAVFFLAWKSKNRIAMAAGVEHLTFFRFSWRDVIGAHSKRRPVELYIWKVEDVQSSGTKLFTPNDMYVECHLGYNEPMRTRVHNNAGSSCLIKESFQLNIDENSTGELMTLLVKDQGMVASAELARLMLSTRELCGVEDQTGKRRAEFDYSEETFVSLKLLPRGQIWLAIAPVEDLDEERASLVNNEDKLVTC